MGRGFAELATLMKWLMKSVKVSKVEVNRIISTFEQKTVNKMKILIQFPHILTKFFLVTCKEGWVEFESRCYLYMTGLNDILKYQESCQEQGGDLVSVHSKEENRFILDLMDSKQLSDWTWLGGECFNNSCSWFDENAWNWENFAYSNMQPSIKINA